MSNSSGRLELPPKLNHLDARGRAVVRAISDICRGNEGPRTLVIEASSLTAPQHATRRARPGLLRAGQPAGLRERGGIRGAAEPSPREARRALCGSAEPR